VTKLSKKEIQSSNFEKKMPYRRLPNTDKARVRAMDNALKKSLSVGQENCAISETTFTQLDTILPQFQHGLINLDAARRNQISKNKEYTEIFKKARIYISHFIQVLNFAIARGELKEEVRDFYDLTTFTHSLPSLITEKDLLKWGKKLIEGEQKRIQKGGNPIYNPSIALVKVNFEKFSDAYYYQKNLISTSKRASKLVNELRPEVDAVILQTWNEVEQTFFQHEDIQKRENASEYGVTYVFRKHEKLKTLSPAIAPVTLIKKVKKIQVKPAVQENKNIAIELPVEKIAEKEKVIPIQSTINF
jgi:hypothetical protein